MPMPKKYKKMPRSYDEAMKEDSEEKVTVVEQKIKNNEKYPETENEKALFGVKKKSRRY